MFNCDCAGVVANVMEEETAKLLSKTKGDDNTAWVVFKSEVTIAKSDLSVVFHSCGVKKHNGDSTLSNTPSLSSSISSISMKLSESVSKHLL